MPLQAMPIHQLVPPVPKPPQGSARHYRPNPAPQPQQPGGQDTSQKPFTGPSAPATEATRPAQPWEWIPSILFLLWRFLSYYKSDTY